MTGYQIERIRLINFHNFVDELVEVRDGGHLFLLGDNGSGKTTVLDAVHYVLSGGELELNAAARLGGRRDEGRTLQGIVLRQDFERGVRNEGGAVAYAAIELHDPDSGHRLSLGIGTEATTLEARVGRWGFVVPRPLAEIALLDAAEVPLDRDALRRALGTNHVFAQLAMYRKDLARRLFGSETQYDDAVRFWSMAKAYREIVTGARDFGALFARLLPPPDTRVFDEILRTIRAIDDLEVALRDLDAQAAYLRGLVELAREIDESREATARYRWLACLRERDELLAGADHARTEAEAARADAERHAAEADAARLHGERLAEAQRRAEADDAAGILAAVREAQTRREELAAEAARANVAAESARREHRGAVRLAEEHRTALATAAREVVNELRVAASDVAELPGGLAPIFDLAAGLERVAAPIGGDASVPDSLDPLPETAPAEAATNELENTAKASMIEARVAVRALQSVRDAEATTLAELEARSEQVFDLAGYAAARRALADAGIAARSVYELVEPSASAAPATLAAIEALAGEEVLGALVVAREDRARARALVAAVAPAIRIAAACPADELRDPSDPVEDVGPGRAPRGEITSADAGEVDAQGAAVDGASRLPGWCTAAIVDGADALMRDARAILAAALSQPTGLGPVEEPTWQGDVALRGLGFRAPASEPRWLGIEARRRAHAARIAEARARLALADGELEAARTRERAIEAVLARIGRLVAAIRAAGGPVTSAAWHRAATAAHAVTLHARSRALAEQRAASERDRIAAIDLDLAALRARATGVDLDELERTISALRSACEVARGAWQRLAEQKGVAEDRARRADARVRESTERASALGPELVAAEAELRACLRTLGAAQASASTVELAHHVRVTLRGDSFRSVDSLRQAIADKARTAEARADELERDGSRGVRCLAHAARFGLVYDRARNHIEDRRGQPVAGVLAELERSSLEQRTVVNEHTRTLMDTLVMGELARHLQGQIHHLHETIKGINRVLRGLRFGASEYQFQVTPHADRAELVELVRRLSILDEESRRQFRAWIDARLDELRTVDDDVVPPVLDYRRWFEFKLKMSTTDAEGVELTQRLRQVGSGGEQGVPNYLLVLALAKLMFEAAGATVRPLLFDEAFYGIDAGRRDQLLRLATDLGLQLFVASPDQDGATPAVRAATTLFVVKDANHDVHLAPHHYWNRDRSPPQQHLFSSPPVEAAPAECRIER